MAIYDELGVRRLINGNATLTLLGGSLLAPGVAEAMWEAGLYHSRYPIYAVIAVAMVMEGTIASTFRSGANRLLGTVVGAAVGGILAAAFSANPFTIGLGFALVALACSALGWADAL